VGLSKLSEDTVEIKRMFTNPEFRKRGLGSSIVENLKTGQRNWDIKKQSLKPLKTLRMLFPFMKKAGFKEFLIMGSMLVWTAVYVLRRD
jgi:GNAT superfamily N-acetyltransferase